MSARHTPGPWVWTDSHTLRPADPDPENCAVHTILNLETSGYGFLQSDHRATRAELDADHLLIATVPELLEAAQAAEAVLGRQKWLVGSTDPEAIALFKLRAAIAKATGSAA